MSKLDKFKELYIRDILNVDNGIISTELDVLWGEILMSEFNDDIDKLELFIGEIQDEVNGKSLTLEERQRILEESVLEIADKVWGGIK